MKILGVAFDLEGTIIDVEYAHFQGFVLAAADIGLELSLDYFKKNIHIFSGIGDSRIAEHISLLAKDVDATIILGRKRFHYNCLLETMPIKPRPGSLVVIRKIKTNGLQIAIGSLTIKSQAQILLERSGLVKVFPRENIVLETDVKNLKPAPDVYLETAKRLGIDPVEQLVFEDSPTGLAAIKDAGSIGVGMPAPYNNQSQLIKALVDAGAIRIFMDWREMNIASVIRNLQNSQY